MRNTFEVVVLHSLEMWRILGPEQGTMGMKRARQSNGFACLFEGGVPRPNACHVDAEVVCA